MKAWIDRIDLRTGIGLVMLSHAVGMIALFTPFAKHVISLTPLNMVLTAAVMVVFSKLDAPTVRLALILGALGYFVEVIGVHTGRIFGNYAYGEALGVKILRVPLLIGLNWSMLVFAVGVPMDRANLPTWAKVLLSSMAMVGLDLLMEPVAVRLGFWSWEQGIIPVRNYVAWGITSMAFFSLFFFLPVRRENPVARYVLLAQVLFFAGLNLLLPLT